MRQDSGPKLEDRVKTNEFYYLVLVLGAFGTFALALAVARLQYVVARRKRR